LGSSVSPSASSTATRPVLAGSPARRLASRASGGRSKMSTAMAGAAGAAGVAAGVEAEAEAEAEAPTEVAAGNSADASVAEAEDAMETVKVSVTSKLAELYPTYYGYAILSR